MTDWVEASPLVSQCVVLYLQKYVFAINVYQMLYYTYNKLFDFAQGTLTRLIRWPFGFAVAAWIVGI